MLLFLFQKNPQNSSKWKRRKNLIKLVKKAQKKNLVTNKQKKKKEWKLLYQ